MTRDGRELIVITGPPGAGKSSASEHLVNRFELSALVTADSFFAMIKQGHILPWLPQSRRQTPSSSRQLRLLLAG